MAEKRNRWLISTVLIVAIGAFVGISILPLLGGALGGNQAAYQSDAPPGTEASSQQEELEIRAQGYKLVLEREPNNQTALRGLLETQIQLGNIEAAIEPLEKLAVLNPDRTEYVVLLAQGKQQIGDLEGAAQAYRDVLAAQPGDMNALQGLVSLLMDQSRFQAAVGLLQDTLKTADQANELQPGSVDVTSVKLLLGQVYAEDGNPDKAIKIYDEAIDGDTEDFRPLLAKAIVLQNQGKDPEAQTLFATAAAKAPDQYKDQISQMAAGEAPNTTVVPDASTDDSGSADNTASEADDTTPDSES